MGLSRKPSRSPKKMTAPMLQGAQSVVPSTNCRTTDSERGEPYLNPSAPGFTTPSGSSMFLMPPTTLAVSGNNESK